MDWMFVSVNAWKDVKRETSNVRRRVFRFTFDVSRLTGSLNFLQKVRKKHEMIFISRHKGWKGINPLSP